MVGLLTADIKAVSTLMRWNIAFYVSPPLLNDGGFDIIGPDRNSVPLRNVLYTAASRPIVGHVGQIETV